MTKKLSSIKISVVCFANYCRSPVAEKLLERRFPEVSFNSYGLEPKSSSIMDPRSKSFLDALGVRNFIHTPKKISRDSVNKADLILAMDHFILLRLNTIFPNEIGKIKLFTYQNPFEKIEDPYLFEDLKKYEGVMKKIKNVVEKFQLPFGSS